MNYKKLDDDMLNTINRISAITFMNYELEGNFLPIDSMMSALKDLLCRYERLEEEFEDYKNQQENDYNPEVEIPQIHGEGISW